MKALLIRHASSVFQGPDSPLTDEGAQQAQTLVSRLTQLGAGPLYASPYKRAVDTIAPYAKATNQSVTRLDGLHERVLSNPNLPDWMDHIRRSFDDPSYAAPGGESLIQVRARAADALTQIETNGGPLPAFVTHGQLISALFTAADPDFSFDDWQTLGNPDLFYVTLNSGRITAFTRPEDTP